jgi:hypothetical protein
MLELRMVPQGSPRQTFTRDLDRWASQFVDADDPLYEDIPLPVIRLAPGVELAPKPISLAGSDSVDIDSVTGTSERAGSAEIGCILRKANGDIHEPEQVSRLLTELGLPHTGYFLVVTGGDDMPPVLLPVALLDRAGEPFETHMYAAHNLKDPSRYPLHFLTDEECASLISMLESSNGYVDYGDGAVEDEAEFGEGE